MRVELPRVDAEANITTTPRTYYLMGGRWHSKWIEYNFWWKPTDQLIRYTSRALSRGSS